MEKKLPINCDIQYMKKDYLYYGVKGCFEINKPLDSYEMKALLELIRKPYIKINVGEPILDEKEREYLSSIIKPFRNKVKCIEKISNQTGEYIAIELYSFENICLPYFDRNTMYKNMGTGIKYALKELDL